MFFWHQTPALARRSEIFTSENRSNTRVSLFFPVANNVQTSRDPVRRSRRRENAGSPTRSIVPNPLSRLSSRRWPLHAVPTFPARSPNGNANRLLRSTTNQFRGLISPFWMKGSRLAPNVGCPAGCTQIVYLYCRVSLLASSQENFWLLP